MNISTKLEVKAFLDNIVKAYSDEFNISLSHDEVLADAKNFIAENQWWGIKPFIENRTLYITGDDEIILKSKLRRFIEMYSLMPSEKYEYLLELMKPSFPVFVEAFKDFSNTVDYPFSIVYSAIDFLAVYLKKDLEEITDADLSALMTDAFHELPKNTGDFIGFFFSWAKECKPLTDVYDGQHFVKRRKKKYNTKYYKDYVMAQRVDHSENTKAYTQDEYLELMYYLINEEYAKANKMYVKAAQSKDYADTWLFLSLHFICALRHTDMQRIYHPVLTKAPELILEEVINGDFDEAEAKGYAVRMMEWMYYLSFKPHKTMRFGGVPDVRFFIPVSLEYHFGMLFAICEAHYQLSGKEDQPFIRCITDYVHINRYMGEQIGSLFFDADFKSRRANKAYMQSYQLYTQPVLGENVEETMGYILASMARSHKGGFASFATTTAEYLKDATFSGLSAEFVAKELFERGVLSSIPSMLLKIITGGEYSKMGPSDQTEIYKQLNMTPAETEAVIRVASSSRNAASRIVEGVLSASDTDERREYVTGLLHRLGNGTAPSLEQNVLCLHMALKGYCIRQDGYDYQCISCPYQIATKASVYHCVCEYNRIKRLLKSTDIEEEKNRYRWILKERLLPSIADALAVMKEEYGEKSVEELYKIISEVKE